MLTFPNKIHLLDHAGDLILPKSIETLYLDFETSSGDAHIDSTNPWHHCTPCLAAFTWDDHPNVYCVDSKLISYAVWMLQRAKTWVNHNVKYDSHVLYNQFGVEFTGEYVDTLTLAKLVDTDRMYSGGYGLDALAKSYCNTDLSTFYTSLNQWTRGPSGKIVNKDYGKIPIPTLAEYAGKQVQANRLLCHTLLELLPAECASVWQTEQRLTQTLVAMERRGMVMNSQGVTIALYKSLKRMEAIQKELLEVLGYELKDKKGNPVTWNPKSRIDCYEILIAHLGFPEVRKPVEEGVKQQGPSFDKHVLKKYMQTPNLSEKAKAVVDLIYEYRHLDTMQGLFWEPVRALHVNNVLHSDNNQCVQTGRMSCSQPNNQQFDDSVREVIVPRPGYAFVVHDFSQIEYRFIAHYLQNPRLLKAYQENPEIDFHQLQADSVGIGRDAAKTMNFAVSFGQGKAKTLATLKVDKGIIAKTGGDEQKIRELADRTYCEFYRKLPELKEKRRMAENAVRERGFVRNIYGRRRHLTLEFGRLAFPSVVQSTAADLIKERANAIDSIRGEYDAHLLALVHDELLSEVPLDQVEAYAARATEILNTPSVPVSVPIRCKCGISTENWLKAKG